MAKPKKVRGVGKEGAGSAGDVRDRFRDVYKPGARPAPSPGLANPVTVMKKLLKKKPKAK